MGFANDSKRRAYQRAWHAKNPERYKKRSRDNHMRRTYNITLEQYHQMYAEQKGLCAICGEFREKLGVDHNHDTGKVRALLCFNCNAGIGLMKENPDRLLKAAIYIEEYNGCTSDC